MVVELYNYFGKLIITLQIFKVSCKITIYKLEL